MLPKYVHLLLHRRVVEVYCNRTGEMPTCNAFVVQVCGALMVLMGVRQPEEWSSFKKVASSVNFLQDWQAFDPIDGAAVVVVLEV